MLNSGGFFFFRAESIVRYDKPPLTFQKQAEQLLESWLRAHHGRLWNREFGYKPVIPKKRKHPEWHKLVTVGNNRVFAILTILKYLMNQIVPQSSWTERFYQLLTEYPKFLYGPWGFRRTGRNV